MYILKFRESSSKYFPKALALAKEQGGSVENGIVTVEKTDVLKAYSELLPLMSFVANWKGTTATYNAKAVNPHLFLLHAHWIRDCNDKREIDNDCGDDWSCRKIDFMKYKLPDRPYKSHKYWYRYGYFEGERWVIDKKKIYQVLLSFAEEKAINLCPFFDESKLYAAVNGLPNFIIPDGISFVTTYKERYAEGEKVQVRDGVLHLGSFGNQQLKG